MNRFCCHAAERSFSDRETVGEFLVAGPSPYSDRIGFWGGFLAAHSKDYEDTLGANIILKDALKRANISNVKLTEWGAVRFCSWCGVELAVFYGPGGGALRDDHFVSRLGRRPN